MEESYQKMRRICDAIEAVSIVRGDITASACDAIVCPDDRKLSGGGGVAAAVRRAAGPKLHSACAALGGCDEGAAKVTEGFGLKAKYVIHTAGPVWKGGSKFEESRLAQCYLNSLEEALRLDCESVAFAGISVGSSGFPLNRAAEIAVYILLRRLYSRSVAHPLRRVELVCFSEAAFQAFQLAFKKEIINIFLEYFSPESCVLRKISQIDTSLYWTCMVKLKNLEPEDFIYKDYTEPFEKSMYAAEQNEKMYMIAQECDRWDYRTCLAYIIVLQRLDYWSGGETFVHGIQCGLGSVRAVLLRMKQLLSK